LKNNPGKVAELKVKGIDVEKSSKADQKEEAKKATVNPVKNGQHTPAQGGSHNSNAHGESEKGFKKNKSNSGGPPKLSKDERQANFLKNNPEHAENLASRGIDVVKTGKAVKKEEKKAAAQAANSPQHNVGAKNQPEEHAKWPKPRPER
jgi:hypothetical protein